MVTTFTSIPQVSKHKQATPTWRPPLSPSGKNIINHNNITTSTKTQSRDSSSRYNNFSSSSPSSSSCSLSKQLPFANRTHKQTTSDATTTRSLPVSFQGKSFSFQTKKKESVSQSTPKKVKTPSKSRDSKLLSKILECSVQKKIMVHDDLYLASDTDSSSSGSPENIDTNLRVRIPNRGLKTPKKNLELMNHSAQLLYPRIGSCIRMLEAPMAKGRIGNMNSVINYGKIMKCRSTMEEAHLMRLLYNRYLQWRFVNAKAELANLTLKNCAENNLYNALVQILELREYVTNKRIKLHVLQQNSKLKSLLEWQIEYLEEWLNINRDEHNLLSSLSKALKASTLRLPIVNGAMINFHDLRNAIGSAVDVMQATGASVSSLLPKMEITDSLMSEVAKAVAHEGVLLEQSKDLLSAVARMHVRQCSLRTQILQLNQNSNMDCTWN